MTDDNRKIKKIKGQRSKFMITDEVARVSDLTMTPERWLENKLNPIVEEELRYLENDDRAHAAPEESGSGDAERLHPEGTDRIG